jgi:hypothetical protein
LPLGLLALQALPLGALLQLGAAWDAKDASQALLPTWVLLLLLAEAFYLARWLSRRSVPRGWMVLCISSGGLATLMLVLYLRLYADSGAFWQMAWLGSLFQDLQFNSGRIAALLGVVGLLALLWWRGLRLGRVTIEHEQVARNWQVGFAVLVGVLLLMGTVDSSARDGLVVQVGLALPLFLFIGLATLSLARLAEIRRARSAQGTTQADPTRLWVMAMLVLSGALVVLLLGIEQAFSYHTLLGVVSAFTPIWDAITAVIGWLAVGVGFVLYWLFSLLDLLLSLLFRPHSKSDQPTSPPAAPPRLPGKAHGTALPTEWLDIGHWVLIGLGISVLLLILIRALRGFARWRRDETMDEERESLDAASVLGAQLRALLANLAARFQRRRSSEEDEDAFSRYTVRRLYRRLLRQTAAQGLGRRAAETPQEYAQRLGPSVAGPLLSSSASESAQVKGVVSSSGGMSGVVDPDLEALTKAYEQARYGNREPSAAQVAELSSDVDRLLQHLTQPSR